MDHADERWEGTTQWDRPVQVKIARMKGGSRAWRVQWGTPGAIYSGGESFDGPDPHAEAKAFAETKMAELGHDWELMAR